MYVNYITLYSHTVGWLAHEYRLITQIDTKGSHSGIDWEICEERTELMVTYPVKSPPPVTEYVFWAYGNPHIVKGVMDFPIIIEYPYDEMCGDGHSPLPFIRPLWCDWWRDRPFPDPD